MPTRSRPVYDDLRHASCTFLPRISWHRRRTDSPVRAHLMQQTLLQNNAEMESRFFSYAGAHLRHPPPPVHLPPFQACARPP
eukprot:5540291-Pleurochrysis_carterae.AAC.3